MLEDKLTITKHPDFITNNSVYVSEWKMKIHIKSTHKSVFIYTFFSKKYKDSAKIFIGL
jgi:hypothetical protein